MQVVSFHCYDMKLYRLSRRCRAELCTLPDYASPSVGRFRCRCGGGVRIRGGVWIRQSGSDFNEAVAAADLLKRGSSFSA